MAGSSKVFKSIDELSQMLPWVTDVSSNLVRFIGVSELLGGLGLVLPSVLRIQPRLTPLAAYGLALVQIMAAIFHISRGETPMIAMNLLLVAIALFIAWGRTKKAPIEARA